jgi:RsiW-degrading membrane proteinase PrsW (M82 family)
VPVIFCVFGGGIHGKFIEMGFCCFCWVFGIGIGFFLLSFFVVFLIGGIFEELVKCFCFFLLTRVNPSDP